jgi:hypothetical protein
VKISKQPAKSPKATKKSSRHKNSGVGKITIRNGVPVFPPRGEVITMEHIRKIMDEEGI